MNYVQLELQRQEIIKKFNNLIDEFDKKYGCLVALLTHHKNIKFNVFNKDIQRDEKGNIPSHLIYFDKTNFEVNLNENCNLDQDIVYELCDRLNGAPNVS